MQSMQLLRKKMKETTLQEAKVEAIHLKNKIGKIGNLFNRNHRHDEPHEQATDRKRAAICESHRYKSFFPERENNKIKWYVDGRDYFWAVSVGLENAKEVIYIEDWWLSPELFLRRPAYFNQEWRLDKVIKRAAERGVQVYVIVYKEVTQALTCNSAHTKHALRRLCPEGSKGHGNIHILRHPDHNMFENLGDMTFYWAHHEKFILIDYHLAFIGGLDLCYGRWDTIQHPLADVHPSGVQNEVWPGQDYNNNRIMDFHTVQDWANNELDKTEYGRMPWHDVAMGLVGECVVDIAEHFVLRWNHIKRDKYKHDAAVDWLCLSTRAEKHGSNPDEDLVAVQRPRHPVGQYVNHPISPLDWSKLQNQGTVHAQVVRSSDDWSSGILNEKSIQNAYCEVIESAEHYVYIENQFFITATGDQQLPVRNTIGRAIVNACLRADREKRKFRIIVVIPAIPGFAGDLRSDAAIGTRAIMDNQYKSINRGEHSIFGQLLKAGVDPNKYLFFFNLRAFDRINKTPTLIQQEQDSGVSYQQLQRAEAEEIMASGIHGFSEEENERESSFSPSSFSASSLSSSSAAALSSSSAAVGAAFNKFRNKNSASSTPAGAGAGAGAGAASDNGNPGVKKTNTSNTLSIQISRTEQQRIIDQKQRFEAARKEHQSEDPIFSADSIAEDAMARGGTVSQEFWEGDPEEEKKHIVQEELYVHCKLLIADDKTVICGSSNLNDRSQLGSRDSELSIVMTDTRTLDSTMDGKPYAAGYHAATLRRQLWREHLGLIDAQPLDASEDPNAQPPTIAMNAEPPQPGTESYTKEWEFVADPLSDQVWDLWTSQATTNTTVYRYLFRADPDNDIKTWQDYDAFAPSRTSTRQGHLHDPYMPAKQVREELDKIRGHLVWMPLDFLCSEEMAAKGLQVNAVTENVYV